MAAKVLLGTTSLKCYNSKHKTNHKEPWSIKIPIKQIKNYCVQSYSTIEYCDQHKQEKEVQHEPRT